MGPPVKRSPCHRRVPPPVHARWRFALFTKILHLGKFEIYKTAKQSEITSHKQHSHLCVSRVRGRTCANVCQSYRRRLYARSLSNRLASPKHPKRKPAGRQHLLMTNWNTIARCSVWIVNLPCPCTRSPVRVHEQYTLRHTLSHTHTGWHWGLNYNTWHHSHSSTPWATVTSAAIVSLCERELKSACS